MVYGLLTIDYLTLHKL